MDETICLIEILKPEPVERSDYGIGEKESGGGCRGDELYQKRRGTGCRSSRERARAAGLSAEDHLARNDAYRFFAPLSDLIQIGPTGTNVCDLSLIALV